MPRLIITFFSSVWFAVFARLLQQSLLDVVSEHDFFTCQAVGTLLGLRHKPIERINFAVLRHCQVLHLNSAAG